jgi:hygromycin-B 4-O-kinase
MAFKRIESTVILDFLSEQFDGAIMGFEELLGGEWSQAFGFSANDENYVIRYGQFKEDYIKDDQAYDFRQKQLPIPRVIKIGKLLDGYYAISERAFGTMIDNLDEADIRAVIPSLLETMDAIRNTKVIQENFFADYDGPKVPWQQKLIDVNKENPELKIGPWKEKLAGSATGDRPFIEAYKQLVEKSENLPIVESLVHNDLLHFNVLVSANKISGVIDWANAVSGDFLYDLAQFVFWADQYTEMKHIDWKAEAKNHYDSIGLDVPMFEQRLQVCCIHMGLGAQAFLASRESWESLDQVAKRTTEFAFS